MRFGLKIPKFIYQYIEAFNKLSDQLNSKILYLDNQPYDENLIIDNETLIQRGSHILYTFINISKTLTTYHDKLFNSIIQSNKTQLYFLDSSNQTNDIHKYHNFQNWGSYESSLHVNYDDQIKVILDVLHTFNNYTRYLEQSLITIITKSNNKPTTSSEITA